MSPSTPSPPLAWELRAADADIRRKLFKLQTEGDAADLLEIPVEQLRYILYRGRAMYPYRVFHVRKRGGRGLRAIEEPHPSVKGLQRKLSHALSLVVTTRAPAHGFVAGRSITTNAKPHTAKNYVLNVDLESFFPSITFARIYRLFRAKPFQMGRPAAAVLAQLCCFQNRLPQGAPTSPIISNMTCMRMDRELMELAGRYGFYYTRYADDITFSTNSVAVPSAFGYASGESGRDFVVAGELLRIIESNYFRVNPEKTRLQQRRGRQTVTGLVVNRRVNVSRRWLRELRSILHHLREDGYPATEARLRARYPTMRDRNPSFRPPRLSNFIRGRLDFLRMVRGSADPTYLSLWEQAHRLLPDALPEPPGSPAFLDDAVAVVRPWAHWKEYYAALVFRLIITVDGSESSGTGFVVARQTIGTAAHVVTVKNGAGEPRLLAKVELEDGDGSKAARPVRFHDDYRDAPAHDVAVCRAVLEATRSIPIRTSPLKVGEEIAALGYPHVSGAAIHAACSHGPSR